VPFATERVAMEISVLNIHVPTQQQLAMSTFQYQKELFPSFSDYSKQPFTAVHNSTAAKKSKPYTPHQLTAGKSVKFTLLKVLTSPTVQKL
jgi:hypothetical protein